MNAKIYIAFLLATIFVLTEATSYKGGGGGGYKEVKIPKADGYVESGAKGGGGGGGGYKEVEKPKDVGYGEVEVKGGGGGGGGKDYAVDVKAGGGGGGGGYDDSGYGRK